MNDLSIWFKRLRKEVLFHTPFKKLFLFKYEFMQSPRQLMGIGTLLESTKDIAGDIVEVGVGYGHTTVFLNRIINEWSSEKKYICIDTFFGFENRDISFERESRGKKQEDYSAFKVNKKKWFDETMRINYINRVTSYEADASTFTFSGPISFCLLDVDIYLPTKNVLEKIWPLMSKGGIIVIHDCKPNTNFDGSLQAYTEFIEKNSLPKEIQNGHGILRKSYME